MRDSREWREAAEEALGWESPAVATVVDVLGSAFRHEGARVFVRSADAWLGSISGGCLEPDVAARGEELARTGQAGGLRGETRRYDLAEEDMWGLGLGCGGEVEVLIEPMPRALYRRMLGAPEGGVAIRPLPPEPGPLPDPRTAGPTYWWAAPDGPLVPLAPDGSDGAAGGESGGHGGELGAGDGNGGEARAEDAALKTELARRASARYRSGESGLERLSVQGGSRRFFFDVVRPPRRLAVVGAGHDSRPLVALAAAAGFAVAVVDPRRALLTRERFPSADAFHAGEPEEVLPELGLGPEDAVVVKNHHKARDRRALSAALASRAGYVGQLGPRSRTLAMLDEMGLAPEAFGDRLRSPVGLDLGGETPDQIAVSIVAELLMWANGRTGRELRTLPGPIHGTLRGERPA